MKIKVQKPVIVTAQFKNKTDDVPSFQEQIEDSELEIENEAIDGVRILILILLTIVFTAVVMFLPTIDRKLSNMPSNSIHRCN